MAQRHFWRIEKDKVVVGTADFKWEPGMSTAQRRRSCINLHEVLKDKGYYPFDASTASPNPFGVELSAFNLKWKRRSIECWYQGSKVYEKAGVQHSLYDMPSREAKRKMKELSGDKLIGFNLDGEDFPLFPRTVFYDWLYLNGMLETYGEKASFSEYDCFTDIQATMAVEACQAKALCIYVLLQKTNQFAVLNSFDTFIQWHKKNVLC